MRKQNAKIQKIVKEYKDATLYEILENVLVNFTFGLLGATLVVFMKEWLDINLMEDVVRLGICKHRRRFNHM